MKFFIGLLMCLFVSGCGVKPGEVSAPGGGDAGAFPQTYPNVRHDPAPLINSELNSGQKDL